MKKRLSMLLAAVAMMATGVAGLGCLWIIAGEPKAFMFFKD